MILPDKKRTYPTQIMFDNDKRKSIPAYHIFL